MCGFLLLVNVGLCIRRHPYSTTRIYILGRMILLVRSSSPNKIIRLLVSTVIIRGRLWLLTVLTDPDRTATEKVLRATEIHFRLRHVHDLGRIYLELKSTV